MQIWFEVKLSGMGGMVFRWQEKSWSKEHVVLQPLTHQGPAWICYLGPLRVLLRQKLHSMNLLQQNDFKHNKYKKEEGHEPYISSFGINNYKANLLVPQVVIDRRLCNIKVVDNWVSSKDILDLNQAFFFLLCSHLWWGKWKRKRENKREKEGEDNPIMRNHHQKPHVNLRTSQKHYFLIPSHWESRVDTIQYIGAMQICF